MDDGGQPVAVDDEGVTLDSAAELQVDVHFDARRVWSFWLHRDGRRTVGDRWQVEWPRELGGFLDGVTQVRLVRRDGISLFDREVRFGAGEQRVRLVDAQGRELAVDAGGRLVTTFDSRDPEQLAGLLDALQTVLDALEAAGVPAFLAYGTLLGAVRDGGLIGHDNDADVAYLSRHDHPVDVIRESMRVQRELSRAGIPTTRYSGAAFRVDLTEEDGTPRGLDVFAGFLSGGHLALMGEVYQRFERRWLLPLGSTVLEGRTVPVPARPEKLLEAMYGASWREPDPAFRFETPASTVRRFDHWFRGSRVNRNRWDRRYAPVRAHPIPEKPHALARVVHRTEPVEATVVDLGCGRGRDAVWLARQGRHVIGLDYCHVAFAEVSRTQVAGLPVTLASLNLLELRSTLMWGARLARLGRPPVLMARHLFDALPPRGRQNFWRLCDMALRGGGTLYLQVLTTNPPVSPHGPPLLRKVDPDPLTRFVEGLPGVASVERRDDVREWVDAGYGDCGPGEGERRATRLTVRWN